MNQPSDFDRESLLAAGTDHMRAGRMDAAEETFQRILAHAPDDADALHLLGLIHFQRGRPGDAVRCIERAVAGAPGNADYHYNLGQVHLMTGATEAAAGCFERAVEIRPEYAEAHFGRASALRQAGRLDDAAAGFRAAIEIRPDFAEAHGDLGITLQKQGRLDDAIGSYDRAVALKPDFAEAHFNRAGALKALGRTADAVAGLRTAIALKPDFAEAHSNLGTALLDMGETEDAVASLGAAVRLRPDLAEVHGNLGNALQKTAQLDEAVACYRRALAIAPEMAENHNNLGAALQLLGRFADAEASLRRAIELKPDFAEAHSNLGVVYNKQGRLADALGCLRTATDLNPDFSEALNNIGTVFKEMDRWDEAEACFHRALDLKADDPGALDNLGALYRDQGRWDEAVQVYGRAAGAAAGNPGPAIKGALLLPSILPSAAAIRPIRDGLTAKVAAIGGDGAVLADPYESIGGANFCLAYHGLNDRAVQAAIADMYLRVAPSLGWGRSPAPEPKGPPKGQRQRLRLGVLSTHLFNHTVGHLSVGLLEQLDRDRFEVVVFRPSQNRDAMAERIDRAADRVVAVDKNLAAARRAVAAEDLDILFYPDIGMEPFTYFLAFSRLAAVQAVTWGHPVTTGIPNVDYFLSSADLEPDGADDHYTERLIRLRHLPAYNFPAQAPQAPADRAHFGLPEGARLYVIPQSLSKFHPDFDPVIGAILKNDADGRIVLIESPHQSWNRQLMDRFRASFPGEAGRVQFLPRMPVDDYKSLLGVADALLDTTHFSGGYTSSEAFSLGHPVVTWPGAFMRGRVTYAQYRAMGIDDLIADSEDSYVALALRLANDAAFKAAMREKIARNSPRLFENEDVVREIERFFAAAVDAARDGSRLDGWP